MKIDIKLFDCSARRERLLRVGERPAHGGELARNLMQGASQPIIDSREGELAAATARELGDRDNNRKPSGDVT